MKLWLMKIHIGQEIKKVYEQSGLKFKEFAQRMNYGTKNIYMIFEREHVSTDILQRASLALNFNFFEMYEKELPFVSEPMEQYRRATEENRLLKEQLALTERLMETKDKLIKEYNKQSKAGT